MTMVLIKRLTSVLLLFICCFVMGACENTTLVDEENTEQEFVDVISSNLPIIYVDTTDMDITSHEVYQPCSIKITNAEASHLLSDVSAGIRLRGHSTSQFDKKPYRIRFDEGIQPLGLGSGPSRSWVLLAEYMDLSMLRNYVAYMIADDLLRLSFVPDFALVEVVVNDVHQGVYLLTEQIEINDQRLMIDEAGVDNALFTDTGYLLETEADAGRRNEEGREGIDWITVPGYTNTEVEMTWQNIFNYDLLPDVAFYAIKSDAKSVAQVLFMQNYLVDAYDAIYIDQSYEAVNAYFDVTSAVDMYLMQIITNDMDSNFSSNYLYKDKQGKIVFGPPWDHDLCFGNHYLNTSPESLHIFHLLYELSTLSWFREMVLARYEEMTNETNDLYQKMKDAVNDLTMLYQTEFSRNHDLWIGTRRNDGWHGIYIHAGSQLQAAQSLVSWLDLRKAFVESYFDAWS